MTTSRSIPLSNPNRHTMRGTLRVFLAESLMFPTGLVTAAFLTRRLGPSGYGLFTLAALIVSWLEWSISSLFARATLKFVGESDDWRPIGATVARLHLWAGAGVAAMLCAVSYPIAQAMHQPRLAWYLILLSLDIPLFSLAQRTATSSSASEDLASAASPAPADGFRDCC